MSRRSRSDLLGDRRRDLSGTIPSGVMGKLLDRWIKSGPVVLEIELPEFTFIRAESFVEDVIELSDLRITLADVISVLYEDYVHAVRSGRDLRQLATDLKNRIQLITAEKKVRSLKPVTENHWASQEHVVEQRRRMVRLRISMERKHALRGEILLEDINGLDPELDLSLEQLVSILLVDFIREIRKGSQKAVIEAMIDVLDGRNG